MSTASAVDEVLIRREGRAGRITLNRPQALNALTLGMVRSMIAALQSWQADPAIELVLIDGAGERGLCAGGDVRWLYDNGLDAARTFWREEYRLNALIGRYAKPIIAIQDGIVMGGGIGVSGHARHRIVTERSQLAMPETLLGLVPDVGGTWLLSRSPGATGLYLGLIGARMNFVDAVYAGFADTYVRSENLAGFCEQLCNGMGEPVWRSIESWQDTVVGASELQAHAVEIEACFAQPSLEAVRGALAARSDPWATKTLAEFAKRSPRALAATFEAVQAARALSSLEAALEIEYRLVSRLYEDGEFIEGVRAAIVDKDRKPKWRPASLAEVTPEAVSALFAPFAEGEELGLAAIVR